MFTEKAVYLLPLLSPDLTLSPPLNFLNPNPETSKERTSEILL
jgi:hypothetical protein